MKITTTQLRRIIKEELQKVLLEHEQSIVRRGTELYLVDDEGNEEYFDSAESPEYSWLEDGEATPFEGGSSGGSYGRRGSRW
jgi:hypothetical protein